MTTDLNLHPPTYLKMHQLEPPPAPPPLTPNAPNSTSLTLPHGRDSLTHALNNGVLPNGTLGKDPPSSECWNSLYYRTVFMIYCCWLPAFSVYSFPLVDIALMITLTVFCFSWRGPKAEACTLVWVAGVNTGNTVHVVGSLPRCRRSQYV